MAASSLQSKKGTYLASPIAVLDFVTIVMWKPDSHKKDDLIILFDPHSKMDHSVKESTLKDTASAA